MAVEEYQNGEVDQHEKRDDLEPNIDSTKNSITAPNIIDNGMFISINRKEI